jgi:hypothetical protein
MYERQIIAVKSTRVENGIVPDRVLLSDVITSQGRVLPHAVFTA